MNHHLSIEFLRSVPALPIRGHHQVPAPTWLRLQAGESGFGLRRRGLVLGVRLPCPGRPLPFSCASAFPRGGGSHVLLPSWRVRALPLPPRAASTLPYHGIAS